SATASSIRCVVIENCEPSSITSTAALYRARNNCQRRAGGADINAVAAVAAIAALKGSGTEIEQKCRADKIDDAITAGSAAATVFPERTSSLTAMAAPKPRGDGYRTS